MTVLSPLRYPGAKRRLAGFIHDTLSLNSLRPRLYVEPFAGGASVALQVLSLDLADAIILGEKDPLVACFWQVLFHDTEWLVDRVQSVEVTVEQWAECRQPQPTCRDRAFACLFLNRTSFSGILAPSAGPIGGKAQSSQYKIDCRFPKSTLVARIRQIAAFRDRILLINNNSWEDTLQRVNNMPYADDEVFYYLDPPFYAKAVKLYTCYFRSDDHQKLHDALVRTESPWVLSYDPAPPIVAMYAGNGFGPKQIEILYSAAASAKLTHAQELVVTNLPVLPSRTRMWRQSRNPVE